MELLALLAAEGDLHPGGEAKGIQMARRSRVRALTLELLGTTPRARTWSLVEASLDLLVTPEGYVLNLISG